MASLWRKSQEIIRDNNDARAGGARAHFFAAGTTTPLVAFRDNALTTPHTHPVLADASGRMPAVFFPLTAPYKERVETATGALLWEVDHVDPAPTVVSGGGSTIVDPLDLLDTGFIMPMLQSGVRPGWVRANGKTIGNAASGASERANADCAALFAYLWNATTGGSESYCPVSPGGRGASAAADFAANKTIALPDLRGRALVGLNGMGNSAAAALNGFTMDSGSIDTLLAPGGAHQVALTIAQMPSHDHGGATANSTNLPQVPTFLNQRVVSQTTSDLSGVWQGDGTAFVTGYTHGHAINPQGSGNAHPNCQPFALITYYIKLNRTTA